MSEFLESWLEEGINLAPSTFVAKVEGKGQNSHSLESKISLNLPVFFFIPYIASFLLLCLLSLSSIWRGQDNFAFSSVGEDI